MYSEIELRNCINRGYLHGLNKIEKETGSQFDLILKYLKDNKTKVVENIYLSLKECEKLSPVVCVDICDNLINIEKFREKIVFRSFKNEALHILLEMAVRNMGGDEDEKREY